MRRESSVVPQGAVYSTALFSCAAGQAISLIFRNSKYVNTIGGVALMSGAHGSASAFTLPRRSFISSESSQNVAGNGVDVRGFLALRRVRAVLRLPSDRRLRESRNLS